MINLKYFITEVRIMSIKTAGIHHITAIVGDAQENMDFYAGILGLRFVKKTINFDDPDTYHFYFGNEAGEPGTIITFFPWKNGQKGSIGDGQVGVTTYLIPEGAMSFWENRLHEFGIPTSKTTRFHESYLQFEDPHGLQLELVERDKGPVNDWEFNGVTSDFAIKGFGGAILYSAAPGKTADTLENVMGFDKIAEEGEFIRFQADGSLGNLIDVKITTLGLGRIGIGTVHHIAWRAEDNENQIDWQNFVREQGFHVTPIQDRNYFNAIYFREKGKILFEIATDPPGFAIDEPFDTMGEKLMLPEQYEQHRAQLEESLQKVEVREVKPNDEDDK